MLIDSELVGLTENFARAKCIENDLRLRVTSKDGEPLIGTCDYRPERVNVAVANEIVTSVDGRG